VSLAAQDSLKNLFATMLLISDRTFRVGDRLVFGDKEGVVEQVGFRSTKLRTPDDSLITLPNALLANGAIDNLGLRKCSRVRVPFSVPPDTPMERVTKLCDDLRASLAGRGDIDAGRSDARLTGINELGVALELEAFVETDDRAVENRCRCELTFEIVRLARENDIEVRGVKK
jgi:MscS family membrane protein